MTLWLGSWECRDSLKSSGVCPEKHWCSQHFFYSQLGFCVLPQNSHCPKSFFFSAIVMFLSSFVPPGGVVALNAHSRLFSTEFLSSILFGQSFSQSQWNFLLFQTTRSWLSSLFVINFVIFLYFPPHCHLFLQRTTTWEPFFPPKTRNKEWCSFTPVTNMNLNLYKTFHTHSQWMTKCRTKTTKALFSPWSSLHVYTRFDLSLCFWTNCPRSFPCSGIFWNIFCTKEKKSVHIWKELNITPWRTKTQSTRGCHGFQASLMFVWTTAFLWSFCSETVKQDLFSNRVFIHV